MSRPVRFALVLAGAGAAAFAVTLALLGYVVDAVDRAEQADDA